MLCFKKSVINRALITALVVGTILVAINRGDALLHGQMHGARFFRIALTVVIPYLVSTISSASTLMSIGQEKMAGKKKPG